MIRCVLFLLFVAEHAHGLDFASGAVRAGTMTVQTCRILANPADELTVWTLPDASAIAAGDKHTINTNLFSVFRCTVIRTNFTMPAVGSTVTWEVFTNDWVNVGDRLYARCKDQVVGWGTVISKPSTKRIEWRNDGDVGNASAGASMSKPQGNGVPYTLSTTNTIKSVDWDDAPGSIDDERPFCADQAWTTLITNRNASYLFFDGIGTLDLTALGRFYYSGQFLTNGQRWYWICYGTNRVLMDAPYFSGGSNGTVYRMTFGGNFNQRGSAGVELATLLVTNRPTGWLFDTCHFTNTYEHAFQDRGGITNKVQGCHFWGQTYPHRSASPAIYVKGIGGTVGTEGLKVTGCTIRNYVDGVLTDFQEGTEEFPDIDVNNNRIYQDRRLWSSTGYGVLENGIDIKMGSTDPTRPLKFRRNHIFGYRPTQATNNPPINSTGQAISSHSTSYNVVVESNWVADANAAMTFNTGATGLTFRANFVRNIHNFGPIEGGSQADLAGAGIHIGAASAGAATPITITGNTFQNVSNAVKFTWAQNDTNGYTITGNVSVAKQLIAALNGTFNSETTNNWNANNAHTVGYTPP